MAKSSTSRSDVIKPVIKKTRQGASAKSKLSASSRNRKKKRYIGQGR